MNFILDPDTIMLLSRQAKKCDGFFLKRLCLSQITEERYELGSFDE